jgi:hypothetical protein
MAARLTRSKPNCRALGKRDTGHLLSGQLSGLPAGHSGRLVTPASGGRLVTTAGIDAARRACAR